MFSTSTRRWVFAPILLACLAASVVGVTAAQASATGTASRLLRTAFSDALASGSVHEVESEVGRDSFKLSDDVSLRDGRQHITSSDGIDAHVLLVGPVAYISGDERTLVGYFGLSQPVARTVGRRWIRIPSSDQGWYSTVAADATLASALSLVKPSGDLVELSPSELDGKSVLGIRGSMPIGFKGGGTDTVFVTRSAHPMLVAAIFAHSGQTVTSSFSSWGERVTITGPTHWIASSKV